MLLTPLASFCGEAGVECAARWMSLRRAKKHELPQMRVAKRMWLTGMRLSNLVSGILPMALAGTRQ